MKFLLLTLLPGLISAWPVAAQQADTAPVMTIKAQTRVVAVAAVVRDNNGPVTALTRDDFSLKVDNQPTEVRYFSQGSDLPLTLALLVDTSGSQKTFIPDETEASMVFFRSLLVRPQDRAALIQLDSNILTLQEITNSVDNLQRGLDYLSAPHASLLRQPGTLLYDALVLASSRTLAAETGRRAIVVLTDGGDHGSRATLEQAIAAAQRNDITVYAIEYSAEAYMTGLGAGRGGARINEGRVALTRIAEATGGRVFPVSPNLPLREIFATIGEDLRVQYQLGFRPVESAPGSQHKIELRLVKGKGRVQARKGYSTP